MKKLKMVICPSFDQRNAVILRGCWKKQKKNVQVLHHNPGVLSFFWSFEIATLGYHQILVKGHTWQEIICLQTEGDSGSLKELHHPVCCFMCHIWDNFTLIRLQNQHKQTKKPPKNIYTSCFLRVCCPVSVHWPPKNLHLIKDFKFSTCTLLPFSLVYPKQWVAAFLYGYSGPMFCK